MGKSKIEWLKHPDGSQGYSINPVKGLCPVACDYCYARAMYKRFKWDETIRFDWSVVNDLAKIKKPSRIFWGSTIELFGKWIDPSWMRLILDYIKDYCPQHTHIFLTKQPQNLIKYSPFLNNCWVGVSATNQDMYDSAVYHLNRIDTKVKFISLEPLLSKIHLPNYKDVDWIIIGSQAPFSIKTFPKWEWIKEIIEACDKTNTPVFLKNNLRLPKYSCEGALPFYKKVGGTMKLRQDIPLEVINENGI